MSAKKSIFLSLLVCLVFVSSHAQEINLAGGIGTPEMANVGLRMHVDQNQFGVSLGTSPGYKNKNFNASADYYYHFGGRSYHANLRPWYAKTGLTYMYSEGEWEERTNLLLVPRLGREFNLTPQFGIALEAGAMFMLMDKNTPKKERTGGVTGDLDLIGSDFILPSAGLKIYYRLGE